MKRMIALCLVLVLCLALTVGCKKKNAATAPTAPTAPTVPGATQTSGNWTVFVPEGWTLVANENNPEQLYLCKGGSDINQNDYIKLTQGGSLPSESICTDVQAVASSPYGNLVWSGFSGTRSGGFVTYLTASPDSGRLLATLWSTQAHLSLDDRAIQAILGGVAFADIVTTDPQPEATTPTDGPTSIAGDWSGNAEFVDCSGDYENKNGLTCQAIARILVDDSGNMTPYIGLAQEGGTIKDLTHVTGSEEMGDQTTGTWEGIPFDSVEFLLDGGKLSIRISIYTETGIAQLTMTMAPLTDGSFETLASQLGCTGYPSK